MLKKISFFSLGVLICVSLTAASIHKFYVSINQINFVSEKKELQITSRFFIDDVNNALEKKHKSIFYLADKRETPEMTKAFEAYYFENFSIKVNNKSAKLQIVNREIEDDVIILYSVSKNISKISSIEVKNTMLFDFISEQQNIIHSSVLGKKRSALLTVSKSVDVLKY
ncbi:DUF6702 family protein [Flavobacterium sp. UBA6135]|uniref:DUF6702 family protein n=1 Tax=Flavobacterium sp. UBA6135 TaxID=1946553 RepID=UPI0025C38EEB|nr:DUF6702 family protein [Flavobacterium sp. UBA6135]